MSVIILGVLAGGHYGYCVDEYVDVRDFGAVGDGVTDDTSAIRNATQVGTGAGTARRIVFFPAGNYIITKPIFLGMFSSSGNGQGSFAWAGETRYWGGGLAYAKSGIHFVGETDDLGNQSRITFKSDSGSYPMFIILGGRDHKFENIQLNGGGASARASEGIFITAGTWGFTVENCVIKNCKRGVRLGNNVNWPEDPIVFKDYENQSGYPTTTGGWMVEAPWLIDSKLEQCDIPVSQETAQTIHFTARNCLFNSDSASGYAIFLHTGRINLLDVAFTGSQQVDIFIPGNCGGTRVKAYGGHTESAGGVLFRKDRVSGYIAPPKFAFHDFYAGTIESGGIAHHIVDGGEHTDIKLNLNANTADGAIQILDIRNCRISGRVGSTNYDSSAKVLFSAENCVFTGEGGITNPWQTFFGAQRVSKIVNCKFTGADFTPDVLRLNYQAIGMFSREADGNSHYSLGAYHYDTNTIYGQQAGIETMHKAYRREGTIYAASDAGSKLVQTATSLQFNTFSGETADTPVDSWQTPFSVHPVGGIYVARVGNNRIGWNSAAPTSGTWSRGDIIWNTAVTADTFPGWTCTASGTPGAWTTIKFEEVVPPATFQDKTNDFFGVDDIYHEYRSAWGDYNNDGWVDLLCGNVLWRNDGGTGFTEIQTLIHLGTFGDFNNDGYLDLWGTTAPYINNGGVDFSPWGFVPAPPMASTFGGPSWADHDNDGFIDVYLGGYESPSYEPDAIYHNTGLSTFSITWTQTAPIYPARGITSCDFDEDGGKSARRLRPYYRLLLGRSRQ